MLSRNAVYLLQKRYCKPGETPEDVFKRTAEWIAQEDIKFEERIYDLMIGGIFLPNSPCLFNSPNGGLHACYTLGISDDLDSIFHTLTQMSKIFKTGGGAGINFSSLRERDAPLSGGGTSSGMLSFMKMFDLGVETVKQGGKRRGALMGICNDNHPDIFDFIRSKLQGDLQNFNLSILVNDEFMKNVKTNATLDLISPIGYKVRSVKIKDVFDLTCYSAWCNGDPAFLFFDRINKDNPFYPELKIQVTNPCSEVALPVYTACCLGSINLSKFVWKNMFNFDKFEDVCKVGMRFLGSMNKLSKYPYPEIIENMKKYNPVGLGIMGFADCLIKLGIRYDSEDCLKFIDQLGEVYKRATEEYDKENFYLYKRIIAPTGSLSILADCSSGVEPVYDATFERRLTVGVIEETRELYKSQYVRTAYQVTPEWHVKVLAQWQKWVNGGVSKSVNIPYEASVDDIKAVYYDAWEKGCKGVTVYRNNCIPGRQVLVSKTNLFQAPTKCGDDTCQL